MNLGMFPAVPISVAASSISEAPDLFRIAPTWRGRLLAAGRFAGFAGLFYSLLQLFSLATSHLHFHSVGWQALAGNLTVAAATLSATAILARLEGSRLSVFGFSGSSGGPLARGAAYGFGVLTVLLCLMWLATSFQFGVVRWQGVATLETALLYGLLFTAVATAEETLWRGYALVNLVRAVTFWPAALILSLIFGLSHLKHDTETMIGVGFAAAYGVLLAWSFRRTGSLWLALGIHAGWDYAQSFVYGVPDSGVVLPGSLLRASMGSPAILTGGKVGPEGSVLMVLVFAALAGLIVRQFRPVRL